jgi:uncharacterized membrane protein YfcA
MYSLGATVSLVFVFAALSIPAGVGGGLVFVPLFQILFELDPKQSAALSQALIAGGSLAGLLFSLHEQYTTGKWLIRRDFVCLFLPSIISGSTLGVLISRMIPSFLQLVLLVLVCLFASFTIFKRAIHTWRREKTGQSASQGTEGSTDELGHWSGWKFAGFVVCMLVVNMCFMFIRGSASTRSIANVEFCGAEYWTIFGVQVGVFGGLSGFFGWRMKRENLWLVGIVMGTGMIAAISGIGGGLVLNPVMLHKGVSPRMATVSCMVIVLVMSLTAAVDYTVNDMINPLWHLSLAGVTFVGSIVGMTGVAYAVKKTGRQSLIVFILGCLVSLGGILALSMGIKNLVRDKQQLLFKSPCSI